jgi:thioredoxin reductase (NADPH)
MPQTYHDKVLIVGSGPAGYTAAIYAARANLKPRLVSGLEPGGQLTITTDVENYPGFADVIQGPWLMEQMKLQAEHVGTQMTNDVIVEVDFSRRPFVAKGDSGDTYLSDVVIIASEQKFRGFGVSACATCDGFFFRGKEVVIVGGGNSAVTEALYLTNHATKVTIVHRRDHFRAEKVLQDRLFAHPKIKVVFDTVADEVLGTTEPPTVTGVKLRNVKTGAVNELRTDGFFVAIGHTPATQIFKGQVKMDAEGYIVTKSDSTETDVPGVFAAGDVKDKVFRQAVTAAGLGCMAALEAEKFIAAREHAAHGAAGAAKAAE